MAGEPEQLLLPCVPPKKPHERKRKRKRKRKRGTRRVRCAICGELGTNRRTCPAAGH